MKPHPMSQNVEADVRGSQGLMADPMLLEAVRRARAGIEVEENFRIIDARLRPRLLHYLRTCSDAAEDAEDLVQKTLTRVYMNVQQLESEEKFMGWLFAIARNVRMTAAEQRRREDQFMVGGMPLAETMPDPRPASWSYDQQLEEQRLEAVRAAIESLPAQQRQCLVLRVRDEMSYEEIAETLQLSLNTVRNHLAEAKKNLRRKLATEFGESVER
jgi:RNA polymerase sigma-70 factor (ECF subfamily)